VAIVIPDNITQLLLDWSDGDQMALDKLMPFVEAELRRLAHNYMRRERRDHTLQTTAVVNEAYIRLVNQKEVRWQNRAHFFAIAASFMRRILVDYAKSHKREKRGGDAIQISLADAAMLSTKEAHALLELDLALDKLANLDERKARVIEYRYFGGLTADEVAQVLKISLSTVERDWVLAKAWLRRETGYER